jgi:excisionase family DNA binding protein
MRDPCDDVLLLTIPQTAALLNISRTHCWELVRRGELPSIRLGRAVRINRDYVEALVASAAAPCPSNHKHGAGAVHPTAPAPTGGPNDDNAATPARATLRRTS